MENYKGRLGVGVHNNSTDLGRVGRATTRRGAIRVGKAAAEGMIPTGGPEGYNYKIRIYDLDNDNQEIETIAI